MVEIRATLQQTRLGLLFILFFFVNCLMDGWLRIFSQPTLQLIMLPYTLCFLGLIYLYFHPEIAARWLERWGAKWAPAWQNCLQVAIVFVVMMVVVFLKEAQYYGRFGYRLHLVPTMVLFGAVLVALLYMQRRREIRPLPLLLTVMGCYVAVDLLSFYSFPLAIQRSDMLPMLHAAGNALLAGHDPYRYFSWPTETVFCPYLPVTIMAFIPGVFLGFDLRILCMIYMLIGAVLIYRSANVAYRREVAALLSLFLLSNYLLYRHETYLEVHWLSLIVFAVLLGRGKVVWAAFALGVSLAVSQLSLVIFPFIVLHALQRDGWKKAVAAGGAGIGAVVAILGPFILWSPKAIYYGTLGQFYAPNSINARPMNLSYWLGYLVEPKHLKWCQLAVLIFFFFYCFFRKRCCDAAGCLQWMALSFLSFILLNVLIDGYFYLTLLLLLLMHLCIANGWWNESQSLPAVPSPS